MGREREGELTCAGVLCRFMAFLGCLAGGAVCFFVAFLTLPILAIKPRKFAVAFTFVSPPPPSLDVSLPLSRLVSFVLQTR